MADKTDCEILICDGCDRQIECNERNTRRTGRVLYCKCRCGNIVLCSPTIGIGLEWTESDEGPGMNP